MSLLRLNLVLSCPICLLSLHVELHLFLTPTLSCGMRLIFLFCSSPFLCFMSPLLPLFSPQTSVSLNFLSKTVRIISAILSSQSHKANSHAVRFRVCQLINKLLGSMAENAQIDDDLFDRIHQAMLVRVTDKLPNVRIQAALAMTRLQQPKDPDCPTINGLFSFSIWHTFSFKVTQNTPHFVSVKNMFIIVQLLNTL